MFWLMIGYMYLFIHRPFEVWPALGTYRLELLYALLTGGAWLIWPGKRWLPNPMHRALFAFVLALLVAGFISPYTSWTFDLMYRYLTLLFFYVLLVTVVHEEGGLKRVGQAFLVIMMVYMLHSLWEFHNGRYEYRMNIVRLLGVASTSSDPNSFAATLVYAAALVPALWFSSASKWWRCFLVVYVAVTGLSVSLTGSRAGFVSMVLLAGLVILRSRWRLAFGVAAIAAAPLLWCALPASLQNRFETIVNPDVGPLNARVSAEGRVVGFWLGIELWQANPLAGVGPGAWRPATGKILESHNLYGQVMGEMGTLGVVTFTAFVLTYWLNVRRIRRVYRDHPHWERDFLYHLSPCLGTVLLLLLLNGNFGHNLYAYTWIWFGAFAIVARYCVEQRLADESWATFAETEVAEYSGREVAELGGTFLSVRTDLPVRPT